jgi:branched-chain amino acid transport system substrate-binding protein
MPMKCRTLLTVSLAPFGAGAAAWAAAPFKIDIDAAFGIPGATSAQAVCQTGTTQREAVRTALEHLGPYRGLVKTLERPFTPTRHDALSIRGVFMARFAADGAIEPLAAGRR